MAVNSPFSNYIDKFSTISIILSEVLKEISKFLIDRAEEFILSIFFRKYL